MQYLFFLDFWIIISAAHISTGFAALLGLGYFMDLVGYGWILHKNTTLSLLPAYNLISGYIRSQLVIGW
jgi:hypothetical protein